MAGLLRIASGIDGISRFFAWIATWLVLLSCLISAGNAASRYLLSLSSNAWLEIQWQMFAGIFLLAAPWVLKVNEHVRVDLLYGMASERKRLWIDVIGIIFFLFPVTIMVGVMSWGFFLTSYHAGEMSMNAGGLPVWPVKLLLPLGMALMFLQGAAELIKRIAALRGFGDATPTYEKPLQ
ncbi:TRAP transporter small permease subunit [Amaricoccus sp.]|uniref:TRAP transporter small permease subunit n=1 Tax=Amaricoccus sp. TaxID=1872485 RepID=UPI001B765082|nr:TRAP transporter small permease subunit [Amaricoccus sp.]MBP7243470.1 TRAP transporter small permease subunit [Amaricoccus sp.]